MSDISTDVALDVVFFRRWMTELAGAIDMECDELTRLDAAIGDADHGINMRRGMRAVLAALDEPAGDAVPADVLLLVGNSLITEVGGAAGPLYGTAFRTMADALGPRPTLGGLATAVGAGLDGIQRLGAAESGDKTIVDAWIPAAVALRKAAASHQPLRTALSKTEQAARLGMLDTIPLRARKGRASYLGWRSEGHQDPGATSTHLLFSSLAASAG